MFRPALWSVVVAVSIAAQDAPPQFRARTDLITLDVSVLYPDRRPVRGLEARHFVLLEDGVEQPIDTFAEVVLADPAPMPDGWQRDTAADVIDNADNPVGRLVAIVLDDGDPKMKDEVMAATQRVARDVIARLSPGDRGAVMFPRHRELSSVVTADRASLMASVNRMKIDRQFISVPAFQSAAAGAVRAAALALGSASDRRKIVVFVSPGAPIDMTKEMYDGDADIYWHVDGAVGVADRDNVSIYAVDPTVFLEEPADLSQKARKQRDQRRDFLQLFTEWGFGFAVVDTSRYVEALDRIFREHTAYYTLGYRTPVRKKPNQRPEIEVRVKRQALLVRARTTRVDETALRGQPRVRAPKAPPSQALRDAQTSLLPQTDVPMTVAIAAFRIPGKNEALAAVTVAVEAEETSGADATTSVAFSASQPYSRDGYRAPVSDYVTAAHPAQQRLEVQGRLPMRPGYQRVDVAAERVPQGGVGSVRVPVDVPNYEKDRFAVSGVVVNAVADAATPLPPALAAIVPFPPTTRRSFDAGERVRVFLQVYVNGKPPVLPVSLISRVQDAAGMPVFSDVRTLNPDSFGPRGSADVVLEPPLASLQKGPYLLSLEATRDTTMIRRDVRFEIR